MSQWPSELLKTKCVQIASNELAISCVLQLANDSHYFFAASVSETESDFSDDDVKGI